MISLSGYFDVALVVNLRERADRRRDMEKELLAAAWSNVEFFPAHRFADAAGFGKPSVRGCFMSHLDCLRRAQQVSARNVLLLEDDLTLAPNISRLTPAIIDAIDKLPWSILYFGYKIPQAEPANLPAGRIDFERTDREVTQSHFYAVNGPVIPRLITHLERLESGTPGDPDFGPMPLDGALNTFRRNHKDVTTYLAMPMLGWQRPSPSDISPKLLDRVPVLRKPMATLRQIKHFSERIGLL
jgi:glycosyl transferase family 25